MDKAAANRALAAALLVIVPSLGLIGKFGGWPSLPVIALLIWGAAYALDRCRYHPAPMVFPALFWGGWLTTMLVAFAILFPMADSGVFGPGSDRDEALTEGALRLLRGEDPYAVRTYLGNALSPMPGALVLAMPFALAGEAGWQNPVWVLCIAVVLACRAPLGAGGDRIFAAVFLSASPVFMQDYLTGGDFGIAVLLLAGLTWGLARAAGEGRMLWLALLAVAFGVALSSRIVFPVLLPLTAGLVFHRGGRKAAMLCIACAVAGFGAVTGPVLLIGGAEFAPLTVLAAKAGAVFPFGGRWVSIGLCAATGVTAALLAVRIHSFRAWCGAATLIFASGLVPPVAASMFSQGLDWFRYLLPVSLSAGLWLYADAGRGDTARQTGGGTHA